MPVVKDLTGKRYGRLVVIRVSHINPKSRKAMWACLCDCGNSKIAQGTSLSMGWTSSCGCLIGEGCKLRPYEAVYNGIKRASVRRDVRLDLSYVDFLSFVPTSKCHYCLGPIVWARHHKQNVIGGQRYNLDRMDNTKGYTLTNCVVCCGRCNKAKSDTFTYEEWFGMTAFFRNRKDTNEQSISGPSSNGGEYTGFNPGEDPVETNAPVSSDFL